MMRSHEHDAVNCLPGTSASTASHAETSTSTCTPVSDASHEHDFACTRTHSRSSHEADAPNFDCNICLDVCYDPVVTTCGHLFCWPCLYHWLSLQSVFKECPVCKENVQLSKTIPLYGCGKVACSEFLAERFPGACIPCRPSPMMDASREPFTSGMANHGSDLADIFRRDHEDRDHRRSSYNVPSLNLGFWHLLLQVFMSLLPPYMSRLFQRIGIPSLADQGRRFNNEKEFVLHWGFIVFALLATLGFLIC